MDSSSRMRGGKEQRKERERKYMYMYGRMDELGWEGERGDE